MQFGRAPDNQFDNPVVGRGASRHPVYAALCNGPSEPHLREKFRLLQGHLLFAQANELQSQANKTAYENYGAQSPWKGLPNSPAIAALLVREISEDRHASILQSLSVELPPHQFADSLNTLPRVPNVDLLKHLVGFRNFIQKAAGLREWISRRTNGGRGVGGSPRIHGHVEITSQINQTPLQIGDPEDPDSSWGVLALVTGISPNSAEQRELLSQDTFPDEFDTAELFLTGDDGQSGPSGNIAARCASQLRHLHMANQMFPWNYQNLTLSEVADALQICSGWVKKHFPNPTSGNPTDDELRKLESICVFRTMLFTSSTLERARELLLLPLGKEGNAGRLALITTDQGVHEWRIQALQPDYRTKQSVDNGSELPKTDFFTLPDIGITTKYIHILRSQSASENSTSTENFRVFRSHEATLRTNLRMLLKELDPTGRLTESKISKFLFFRILETCKGDICAASMISGDEHRLAHVRLFYAMIPAEHLQNAYLQASQELVSLILAATGKATALPPELPTYIKGKYVGSRLRPSSDAVKSAINQIKLASQNHSSPDATIDEHNHYSLITVWHFAFATACRAIETPYSQLTEIDQISGLTLIADKDDGTKYKARLAWIPEHVIKQMVQYQDYRSNLLLKYPHLSTESLPPIFFLQRNRENELQVLTVRPKSMEAMMQPFIPYPSNFHRRFMRSELLSRGCPAEVVDAYMGHWSFGEEPWSQFSSFSFEQYRAEMKKHLIPLMNDIGLGED